MQCQPANAKEMKTLKKQSMTNENFICGAEKLKANEAENG